jgi:hypothetical protein
MRIYFQRSGGIFPKKKEVNIDTNLLPSKDAQRIESAVKESKFFSLPSEFDANEGAADYFQYQITVEANDGKKHTVEIKTPKKPDQLKDLIGILEKKSSP